MLKHTILAKKAHQSTMNATSNDAELEAALLSLDQSQLTQNLMKEFINAGNQSIISEGGNA